MDLAKDLETGEYVALKKLFRMDAKSVLRLKREFRALGDVAHPNIVKLYDMGRAADAWFLTMEYLDGVDLTTFLTRDRDSQPGNDNASTVAAHGLSALRQLALGIRALHQAGPKPARARSRATSRLSNARRRRCTRPAVCKHA